MFLFQMCVNISIWFLSGNSRWGWSETIPFRNLRLTFASRLSALWYTCINFAEIFTKNRDRFSTVHLCVTAIAKWWLQCDLHFMNIRCVSEWKALFETLRNKSKNLGWNIQNWGKKTNKASKTYTYTSERVLADRVLIIVFTFIVSLSLHFVVVSGAKAKICALGDRVKEVTKAAFGGFGKNVVFLTTNKTN